MIPSLVIYEDEFSGGGGPVPFSIPIPSRCFIKSVAVLKGTVEVDTLRLYDRDPSVFDNDDPANKHLVVPPITTTADDPVDTDLGSAFVVYSRNGYPYISDPAEGDSPDLIWGLFTDSGATQYNAIRITYLPAHH